MEKLYLCLMKIVARQLFRLIDEYDYEYQIMALTFLILLIMVK